MKRMHQSCAGAVAATCIWRPASGTTGTRRCFILRSICLSFDLCWLAWYDEGYGNVSTVGGASGPMPLPKRTKAPLKIAKVARVDHFVREKEVKTNSNEAPVTILRNPCDVVFSSSVWAMTSTTADACRALLL